VRAEQRDIHGSDSIVRFGQKVRIEANCHLYKKTIAVGSMPHGPSAHAALSHNQECSMHPQSTFNNVWIIDSMDPNFRFERQGEPVKAGECVMFRHCQTT
jgi:Ca2+-binding EF-hand superfamily protein